MTVTARALYVYTGVEVEAHPKTARAIYAFTNVAAAPDDKQARALYAFTNVGAAPGDKAARTVYIFTNVVRLTDVNDGVEVQLLDENLETEHILRGM